ncbi:hypothetical protein N7481_002996 [Penicillium waksmanii]|uniref:uncharacterized protein n=1 Tax=Penicillium waksmanii TaxID=69791 RepID=UPI0025471482|nr:uncharacterized protein N7481_002996 [Penicillium waksmanii]KAJ5987786.1 hypothetical protein N7481_002996 [Penicillium waksmanii]
MSLQTLVLALLFAWLVYAAISHRPTSKTKEASCSPPPIFPSWIPFAGHIYGIATKGSNPYLSSLCSTQNSPIKTLKLPGMDMHLVHPLDSASMKQFTSMPHLSLMTVFRVAVGPSMGLLPASEKVLTDPDTGDFKRGLSKLFNGELRKLDNLRKYAGQMDATIDRYWDETAPKHGSTTDVSLGSWIFDFLSRSMGGVFWGEEGPFEEKEFRDNLRIFIQNLESLRNPIPWLVPSEIRSARKSVRDKISQSTENKSYGKQEKQGVTLFAQLASLYESLEIPREGFTDCHLTAIVGLMSNVINIMIWAMCEVLANPELLTSLLTEIKTVVDDSSSNMSIEVDHLRRSCPLLVATWYELLRTYGDAPVARGVHESSLFDNKYQLEKGSILMTPIHLHNFDRDIWGEDVELFRPSRFLQKDGEINQELVKHLNVFGLPGMHQCPGRYLALNLTVGLLAKSILAFEFTPTPGEPLGWGVVPARKDTMLGLPALSRDPTVVLKRRDGIQGIQLLFDNVKPGW